MRMSQSQVINPENRAAEPEQQVPTFTVYLEHFGHLLKKKKISCSRSAARPKKLYLKELLR